jgi:nucleoside-diphosphate-sugar epimerase
LTSAAAKVLITGGAGFIGFHLAGHLLEQTEARVVLADNLSRGRMDRDLTRLLDQFPDRVQLHEADLTDRAAYDDLDQDFDQVFHLAAVNGTKWFYQMPQTVLRTNILSLFWVLDWLQSTDQKPTFCFTSSNEAYAGALEAFGALPLPTPETVPLVVSDPFNPRWSYAGSKLIGEQIVIHTCDALDIPAVIVRPHNFYGPRAGFDHVIPELCQRVARREDPFVLFGAEQTRTFCYIDDAVSAIASLVNHTVPGTGASVYNVGGTEEVTMAELAEKVFRTAGWQPRSIEQRSAPTGSVSRRKPDITKIRNAIGWTPRVSLDEGLRSTFAWYALQADLPDA